MKIKLEKDLPVGGAICPAGAVLTVGKDITEWQAEKALALGVAKKEAAPVKKAAKK